MSPFATSTRRALGIFYVTAGVVLSLCAMAWHSAPPRGSTDRARALSASGPTTSAMRTTEKSDDPAGAKRRTLDRISGLPLAFEPREDASFLVRTRTGAARVTRTGLTVTAATRDTSPVAITFGGASASGELTPAKRLPGHVNYLIGNDRSKWRTHVPTYGRVEAREVYPGIEIAYYGTQQHLEYDFIVQPHVDPTAFRLEVKSARPLSVSPAGDLTVEGEIVQRRPIAYQTIDGVRRAVVADYVARRDDEFGIRLGEYDTNHALVIDPVVLYAFTTGGSGEDTVNAIAVDVAGATYVAGTTTSTDFPVVHPYQATLPDNLSPDGFVLKLNAAGTAIEYATYFGGSSADDVSLVGLDAAANIYLAGITRSADFPGIRNNCAFRSGCLYVSGLSADGSRLNGTSALFVDSATSLGSLLVTPGFVFLSFGEGSYGMFVISTSSWEFFFTGTPPNFMNLGMGPDGVVYLAGFDSEARAVVVWRQRERSVISTKTFFGPLVPSAVAIMNDGSYAFVTPDKTQFFESNPSQADIVPLPPLPAQWDVGSSLRPSLYVDAFNRLHVTLCGSWTLPSPGSECVRYVIRPPGVILRTDTIPRAPFATDREGMLYTAGGSPDVVVRKYSLATVDDLTSNTPEIPLVGTPITFTATATPASGLEFSFWRSDPGVGWSEVQPYSSSRTYTWTPTNAGSYDLQVFIRHIGQDVLYDSARGVHIEISAVPLPLIIDLRQSINPVMFATTVTWNVTASGVAPLEYQFWRLDAGSWHLVRDYSSSSSYTWTPGVADAGAHALQVWVRYAGSTFAYQAYTGLNFEVVGPPPPVIDRLDGPTVIQVGGTGTWTLVAHGGVAPLQFQFWRRDYDGWHLARDYSSSNTYTWTTTLADPGPHAIQARVRNAGSIAAFESSAEQSFDVRIGPEPVRITRLIGPTGTVPAGGPISFTVEAAGGAAPLEYAFWQFDTAWRLARSYSTDPTYTYSLAVEGTHSLQVWVRSAGSMAPYEAWTSLTFEVGPTPPVVVTSFTANAIPARGVPVTWTATATGGYPPLQYQFWRLDSDGWHLVRDASSDNSYIWTPGPGDVGTHTLQVFVYGHGLFRPSYDAWAGFGPFVIE
jgi:hypothetical protein